MPLSPLTPAQLRRVCDPASLGFETTASLTVAPDIIGQPRGTRAIEFGIDIESPGYNIFVLGEEGTGRTTAIGRFLRQRAATRLTPQDWVYVNNFAEPHRPRALNLPAGMGTALRDDMTALVSYLRRSLPQAFEQEAYTQARNQIQDKLSADSEARFSALQSRAAAVNIAPVRVPDGWSLVPLRNGEPMDPAAYGTLPEAERKTLEADRRAVEHELEDTLRQIRELEKATADSLRALDKQVAASVVDHQIDELKAKYGAHAETACYLDEVRGDLLDHVSDFLPAASDKSVPPDFRRYGVNVVVDHGRTAGAPVIVELNPTFSKLMGRIEHEARMGALVTDFTLIKTGSLHAANGGYLVLRARDVYSDSQAWDALKRSLLSGFVRTEDIAAKGGFSTTSLDPEPIPLDLKVVLVGSSGAYYFLFDADEDFANIFKVKADFSSEMPRTPENEQQYAGFVAARCAEESLRPFDCGAVAKVVEFGSRAAQDQTKLSVRFGEIADLLREANYWAGKAGHEPAIAADVQKAVEEKVYRSNETEQYMRDRILEGSIFIDTSGEVVGQVNALSVSASADYSYCLPSRITARTFVGHSGISQIERDTNMAGPIHNKGLLTLTSFFNATYASQRAVSFSAQITFEQTYGGVEGDSASCAELYALISSLSGRPVKQSLAVTGAVNQEGNVQPIGAVNEKIEGFFAVCEARGLTGEQGVLIPATNVRDLMLSEKVVAAAEAGRFHIWPISTVDEGIEILTGAKAGARKGGRYPENTVHGAGQKRLRELARGHDHERDDDRPRSARKKTARKKRVVRKRPVAKKRPARKAKR